MCLHQARGMVPANITCRICENGVKTAVAAKASKVAQSAAKALVTSAAKKTGYLGPTFSGTGNTQRKM
ncbi:hypothetical protein CNMCM5793_006770 [Aspergillus hiratsukae]|uniref:Uncharacterized protein n=1 Tax=Aspergillus hiratsukae TaxID=1194566 RepID=A0A8H6UM36_9EURO|nr:hypothetical protein CNMCM5793_006770 [Aspergillus hiratsukae]KAF7156365.1 hypothetical protein CNMCM6106_009632 [Aspergillus hiratsukae]